MYNENIKNTLLIRLQKINKIANFFDGVLKFSICIIILIPLLSFFYKGFYNFLIHWTYLLMTSIICISLSFLMFNKIYCNHFDKKIK